MRNMDSRFAINPQVNISRSKFNRDSSVKTSFNTGQLIPFYVDEVLPGDTFQIRTSLVARLQPLVTAPMDNLYLDTYYFFVPNRLVWNHWKELNGENTESAWIPETVYQVPQITAPTGGWSIGTIADYMGLPVGVSGISVSALPFRAYSLIVNEWFRDQNLQDPLETPVDDTTVVGVNTGNYITDCAKGGQPFVAAKLHDLFTSALPGPQKSVDVMISPVSEGSIVYTGEPHNNNGSLKGLSMALYNGSSGNFSGYGKTIVPGGYIGDGSASGSTLNVGATTQLSGSSAYIGNTYGGGNSGIAIYPNNLYASSGAPATTINQLRIDRKSVV